MSDDKTFELVRDLRKENQEAHKAISDQLDTQNGRIDKLETWRSGICYVGGFIVLVMGALKWLWKPGG